MPAPTEAESLLKHNLLPHVDQITDFTHVPIEKTGLLEDYSSMLQFTHFDDIYDSLIYSKLISKALTLCPDVSQVIDLGAGSSIPSLLALKNSERENLFLTAIDIDPHAEVVGSRNAARLGVGERYSFQQESIHEVIQLMDKTSSEILIVSNPPYIASPPGLNNEAYFVPVNGGPNGDDFLLKILRQDYATDTTLALLWGSLTSPHEVLSLIRRKFHLIHAEAYRIHFGNYTSLPLLKEHLYKLKEKGKIYFEQDEVNGEMQLVFGTILRAK